MTFQEKCVSSVCFYHVTYAFQSESTLYSCLKIYRVWIHSEMRKRHDKNIESGKPLFVFHNLVSTICSCSAIIELTFFVSILHYCHLWLSSSIFSYISLCIFFFVWFFSLQFSDFPFIKCFSVFHIPFHSPSTCYLSSHTPSFLNSTLTSISFIASSASFLIDFL